MVMKCYDLTKDFKRRGKLRFGLHYPRRELSRPVGELKRTCTKPVLIHVENISQTSCG